MGIRFLFLLLAVFALWLIIKHLIQSNRHKDHNPRIKTGKMLACKQCGLHIPENESVKIDDDIFCCHEHAEAYRKNH